MVALRVGGFWLLCVAVWMQGKQMKAGGKKKGVSPWADRNERRLTFSNTTTTADKKHAS